MLTQEVMLQEEEYELLKTFQVNVMHTVLGPHFDSW